MKAAAGMPVAVTAVAARTPVGDDATQTASSIRARVSRYAQHAFADATARRPEWEDEEPLTVAAVASLDPDLDGAERLFALLRPVLAEVVASGELGRKGLAETTLLCALPAPEGAAASWGLDLFLADALKRTGIAVGYAEARPGGHAGMLALLADAASRIASRAASRVIVAGVDSWLSFDRLLELDRAYRAKSARNVDGFVPGEAATAVLVESQESAAKRGARTRLRVHGLGWGAEPNRWASELQSSGAGLVEAVRDAWGGDAATDWVICDLNGESYRAFEWGVTLARASERIGGSARVTHPAECTGDVGAATGGLLLATAAGAFERGWAPAGHALAWASSDDGSRVAARLGPA